MPFFQIFPKHEIVGSVRGEKVEALPGTNGQTAIPIRKTIEVELRVDGKNTRWPPFFSDNVGCWQFYAKDLADEITKAGLTGIEFHPIELTFGRLRRLEGTESICPKYVWARVHGVVHADVYCQGRFLKADETGMYLIEQAPSGYTCRYRLWDAQRQMSDFNRIVPANSGRIVLSEKGATFLEGRFDRLNECAIQQLERNWVI